MNAQGYNAFSNDGNLELWLEADTLPGNESYVVKLPLSYFSRNCFRSVTVQKGAIQ